MSSTVLSLPLVQVNELLDKFKATNDLSTFLKAFETTVASRLARRQLLPALQHYIEAKLPSLDELQKMVEWAERIKLEKSDPAPPRAIRPSSPKFDALLQDVRILGAEVAKGDQFAEGHRYWFFRPAWQVQSALWNEVFGEDDPAITIARYALLSFKSRTNSLPKLLLLNDNEDLLILTQLINHLKGALQVCKGINPTHFRAVVTGAMSAEHLFSGERLSHDQFPFETILESTGKFSGIPNCVAHNLLQFWGRSISATYSDSFSDIDETSRKLLVSQARFVGAVLIKYVSDSDEVEDAPKLDYISDLSFTDALFTIQWLRGELDADELDRLVSKIVEATDRARVRKFGGRLPFSFHDASDIYADAYLDTWISQIASYTTERYDDHLDRFSCTRFLLEEATASSRDKRENRHAVMRYRAYRDALDEMLRDGLDELASAWWSFFIASQAMTFRGLDVPPDIFQEILHVARTLKDNEAIIRSLRFVASIMLDNKDDVLSLAGRASLQEFLREVDASPSLTNIFQLGHSEEVLRRWLERSIGPEIWAGLSANSQVMLIEAEQLWDLWYRKLGVERDWGGIVMLSVRAVEAEVRDQLKEIFDSIEREAEHHIHQRRTLGGCLKAIRAAREKGDRLSSALAFCVASLGQFFDKHNRDGFLDDLRISAAHAKKPIPAADFYKWRELIFTHGVFEIVARAARSFK